MGVLEKVGAQGTEGCSFVERGEASEDYNVPCSRVEAGWEGSLEVWEKGEEGVCGSVRWN